MTPADALVFYGCESSEQREIARLVSLDLAAGHSPPPPGRVSVTCERGRFDIAIERPQSRNLTRSVDLQQLPARARPRMVAIAVVESFAADSTPSRAPSAPRVATSPPAADTSASAAAPTNQCCRLELAVVGTGRMFLGGVAGVVGAGIRGQVARGLVAFDALAELGAPRISEGVVHVAALSSSVTAGWSIPADYASLRMAAGARLGLARLSGEPADPAQWAGQTGFRGWGGPKVEAGLTLHPAGATLLQLNLEAGYTLFSVYGAAAEERRVGLYGAWLGLQLGGGLGF